MAAVGSTVFGAVVNAISFTRNSYLLKLLDHGGYLAEVRKHHRALEQLQKARNKFYEDEVKRKDKIAQLTQDLADANNDEIATNRALLELK